MVVLTGFVVNLQHLDGASEDDETERIKTEKALSDVENKKQAMQNMMELKLKQIEEKCKDGSVSEADLDSILNKPRDTLRPSHRGTATTGCI